MKNILGGTLVTFALLNGASSAAAQTTGEAVRIEYLRDLAILERKFVALAEAFPADKLGWRPAPGIRSVHEVLALIAAENAVLVPRAFGQSSLGGVEGDFQAAIASFGERDRAGLLQGLRDSFVHLRDTWNRIPAAALEQPVPFFGNPMTPVRIGFTTLADQHEHLGQLIAYARMNGVVPPWSGVRR